MNINMSRKSRVEIDGRSFSGKSVVIKNGKVTVDGIEQDGELTGDVSVTVHGDVNHLENRVGTVTANNVGSVKTQAGDIKCGDVSGSVSTMSGDITCGTIGGNASTMSGDVSHRR